MNLVVLSNHDLLGKFYSQNHSPLIKSSKSKPKKTKVLKLENFNSIIRYEEILFSFNLENHEIDTLIA